MSVAHRPLELVARPAGVAGEREVAVRWRVAAGTLTPGARGTALVEIVARRGGDGSMRIEAAVVLADGERRVVRTIEALDAGAWWRDGTGLEHVEAGPTLRATLRPGAPGECPKVLFAQTDVLAELRIDGGRYDRPA